MLYTPCSPSCLRSSQLRLSRVPGRSSGGDWFRTWIWIPSPPAVETSPLSRLRVSRFTWNRVQNPPNLVGSGFSSHGALLGKPSTDPPKTPTPESRLRSLRSDPVQIHQVYLSHFEFTGGPRIEAITEADVFDGIASRRLHVGCLPSLMLLKCGSFSSPLLGISLLLKYHHHFYYSCTLEMSRCSFLPRRKPSNDCRILSDAEH